MSSYDYHTFIIDGPAAAARAVAERMTAEGMFEADGDTYDETDTGSGNVRITVEGGGYDYPEFAHNDLPDMTQDGLVIHWVKATDDQDCCTDMTRYAGGDETGSWWREGFLDFDDMLDMVAVDKRADPDALRRLCGLWEGDFDWLGLGNPHNCALADVSRVWAAAQTIIKAFNRDPAAGFDPSKADIVLKNIEAIEAINDEGECDYEMPEYDSVIDMLKANAEKAALKVSVAQPKVGKGTKGRDIPGMFAGIGAFEAEFNLLHGEAVPSCEMDCKSKMDYLIAACMPFQSIEADDGTGSMTIAKPTPKRN